MEPEIRLVDLCTALEEASTRDGIATLAVRLCRAARTATPDDVRALCERLLAVAERLGGTDDADEAFLLGLVLMTIETLACESDGASWRCPRCRRRTRVLHSLRRPLNRFERRVCARCLDRPEAAGWHCVATDPIDLRCSGCFQLAKPSHVIALVPTPVDAVACDVCADGLRELGWRAAVTRSMY